MAEEASFDEMKIRAMFCALCAPFEPGEVRTRPQGGRELAYVTARTVMNRMDEVLGAHNWWDEYIPQENCVICKISIRLPNGAILTKCDAGGNAGMQDSGDDEKSAFSDAFKRAAVKFGIGRYLYRDGLPPSVVTALRLSPEDLLIHEPIQHINTGRSCEPSHSRPSPPPRPQSNQGGRQFDETRCPRSGKGLFSWAKKQEENNVKGVIKWINDYGTELGFPGRMVDWNEEQVQAAWDEYHEQHGGSNAPY